MLRPHDVVLVVGKRGSGKSHYAKTQIIAHEPRVLTWDPHGEHEARERVTVEQLAQRMDLLDGSAFRIAVTPSSRMPKACSEEFAQLVELVQDVGDYTFVIDEVGIIGDRSAEMLEFVATQSRHFGEAYGQAGVPLVFIAQRAVQVPKTAREQCSQVVTFRQDNDADVAALAERLGAELAEEVRSLSRDRHEFIHWHEERPPVRGP